MANSTLLDTSICKIDSLPCPPHVAIKVIQLSNDPEKGVRHLCEILELDAGLCTSILRIANSAAYSRGRRFEGILQAVSVMGTKATAAIALGFSLKGSLPSWSHPNGLNDKLLWRHSVACAVAGRSIAHLVCYPGEHRAFLCGLLSRIGQLVLFTSAPDAYGQVLDQSPQRFPTPELEEQICGTNHHIIGHYLLETWGLPQELCDVSRTWNDPTNSDLTDDTKTLASIVAVADSVAELLASEDKGASLIRAHRLARDLLGISMGEIERMFEHSESELKDTLAIFQDPAGSQIDCESILAEGRQRLVEMSIEIAEDLAIAKTSTAELEAANRSLQISARTDSLTGLPNRAALTAEANAIWECSRKNPIRHFSVIMVDIDHFKSCNDLHGHRVGDEVLIAVANGLSSVMRGTDFIARYGGEEFTILLTNAGANDATIAAERFRKAVEETSVECGGQQIRVTASFGGASSDRCPNAKSFTDIIDLADQSLYAAKKAGRNRVVFGDQVSLCSPETGSPETGSSATGSPATGSSDTNE